MGGWTPSPWLAAVNDVNDVMKPRATPHGSLCYAALLSHFYVIMAHSVIALFFLLCTAPFAAGLDTKPALQI
jgi:hypothetical protein